MSLLGTHTASTTAEMEALGERVAGTLTVGDVVILSGPLGAGKTTLTRGIGRGLRVRGPITSPTFVLARTHPSLVGGVPLVHVDAYRLGDALELDDLDIDVARCITVVEWGVGLAEGVADSWLDIAIQRPAGGEIIPAGAGEIDEPEEPRRIVIAGHGPRWE
jgi:tRNA threonylcarbamoyl adenosine modification protein YjeE